MSHPGYLSLSGRSWIGHVQVTWTPKSDDPVSSCPGLSTHPHRMCWQWTGQARAVVSVLGWQMEICRSDSLMMGGGMVFGEIICMVGTARLPENVKLALPDPIPDPIELHVDGLGLLLFHSVIGNAANSAIVCLEWHGWLWVAKFMQGNAHGANGLCIQK